MAKDTTHICTPCGRQFPTYWIAMHHYKTYHLGIWHVLAPGTTLTDLLRQATSWRD